MKLRRLKRQLIETPTVTIFMLLACRLQGEQAGEFSFVVSFGLRAGKEKLQPNLPSTVIFHQEAGVCICLSVCVHQNQVVN